jgi:hypothetical protein
VGSRVNLHEGGLGKHVIESRPSENYASYDYLIFTLQHTSPYPPPAPIPEAGRLLGILNSNYGIICFRIFPMGLLNE